VLLLCAPAGFARQAPTDGETFGKQELASSGARVDSLVRPNPGLVRQVVIVPGWFCVPRRRCLRGRVLG
jgi:hypothetical protein